MLNLFKKIKADNGAAAIEFTMVFLLLFVIIAVTYEYLKYQTDISLIHLNEALATERIDMALLKVDPDKIEGQFLTQLKSTQSNGFFDGVSYSNVKMECYSSIRSTTTASCDEKSKIIKISYTVKRLYVSKIINDLAKLPTTLDREIIAINDYY